MTSWIDRLYRELDEWNFDGVAATLWWRDDDLQAPSAKLDRLVALAQKYDVPIALAVVPARVDPGLASLIGQNSLASILQHGYSHSNYAPANEKKAELGAHRGIAAISRELKAGFTTLSGEFGDQFVPVLVPPWNRIAAPVLDGLAQIGIRGLSTFSSRAGREPVAGIWMVNTHVDIIAWKQQKQFIGAQLVIEAMVTHLEGRRLGQLDSNEPTGILTHHLVHDDECWQFLAQLLAALDQHPAVKWLTAGSAFRIS